MLVTVDGEPCAQLRLPHPGPDVGEAYLAATVRRTARQLTDYNAALDRLRARLDPRPRRDPPRLSRSVIICTHRRLDDVATLLEALQALDPAPEEIIVVDNAPGQEDCREIVEAAGARYVREDRVGLDHARRAGLMAASGDLVCFTDDDCAPAVHWLRDLPALFADPSIGAVTGPAFARELKTPAQVRFEDSGGFSRGLRRRHFDWRTLSPLRASAIGAGANMTFRRGLLLSLGDVFPAELDAGTPTQSGGDMIALYRVLAAGARVAYNPSTYVLHRHRRDGRLLHYGMWGYGVGLAAALTKLLVREHELGAIPAWMWLWQQYREAVIGRALGRVDPVEQRIAWDYLRGGLVGPWAWWRTRALEEPPPQSPSEREAEIPVGYAQAAGAPSNHARDERSPTLSVIIATRDRPAALSRCLNALSGQRSVDGSFEVIVVDDSRSAGAAIPKGLPMTARVLRSGGAGAAAARNMGAREARGQYVLFLDDDLVPAPDLLAWHRQYHSSHDGDAIVIGTCPPAPVKPTLAAQAAALWWTDHYRAKDDSPALMFVDVLSGNASLPTALFELLGGFDNEFGAHRREDWDFGVRALRAGAIALHAPEAIARHEFNLTTRGAIASARKEGGGDALLAARWPEVVPTLPPDVSAARGLHPRASARALLEHPSVQRFMPLVLDGLELLRARGPWLRAFHLARRAAYERGRRETAAVVAMRAPRRPEMLTVDLGDEGPIAAPFVAVPAILVRWRGRLLGTIRAVDGQWSTTQLAVQMLDLGGPEAWAGIARGVRPGQGNDTPGIDVTQETMLAPPWDDAGAWHALDARLRSSDSAVVVVSLRRRPGFTLPPGTLDVLASPRVGLVFGGRSGEPFLGPAAVFSREVPYKGRELPYAAVEYLAVRPDVLRAVGGFDPSSFRWGAHAFTEHVVERVLAAGHHVALQDLPGPVPPPPGARATWRRDRAAGSRAVRRLIANATPAGLLEFLRSVPWSWRPHSLGFHGAAHAAGALEALQEGRSGKRPRDVRSRIARPSSGIGSPPRAVAAREHPLLPD